MKKGKKSVNEHEGEYIHIKKTWFMVFTAPFIYVFGLVCNTCLIFFDFVVKLFCGLLITLLGPMIGGGDGYTWKEDMEAVYNPKEFIKMMGLFWQCKECDKRNKK